MSYLWPALFALFLWWFSTGAIIYLDGLRVSTFKWSMAGASLIACAGLYGLYATAGGTTVAAAYLAFASALAVWGWIEISFYMGYVTGVRKERCAHGCSGWRHFGHALAANVWHELAILAFAAVVVALTWGGANQVGTWTFMILWWMHESARLNVFLGVRNLNEHFVPDHLEFLKGFLRKKPMNLLFPFSVTISTVAAVMLGLAAAGAATPFAQAGFTFLTAMMVLAILEHWFLVLPVPSEAMWNWSMASREGGDPRVSAGRGHLPHGQAGLAVGEAAAASPVPGRAGSGSAWSPAMP